MADPDIPHYRVVVLGNSGCRKTAIITRWTTNIFSPISKPTIGSNDERKRVELDGPGPVELYVWDTAGQEQFHSLIPLYARSSSLAIITAVIDDPKSFAAIPRWINAVSGSCETLPPLFLVVNKMDLSRQSTLTVDDIHRDYDGRLLSVFLVLGLTGESIAQLFKSAAIEAVNFRKSHTKPSQVQETMERSAGGRC
jgi:small GTP-binding protein